MSRRSRRGPSGPGLTFFSFQDVMMSVMGVLILITLILSLEIENVGTMSQTEPGRSVPEQSLNNLERELVRLRRDFERLREASLERGSRKDTIASDLEELKRELAHAELAYTRVQSEVEPLVKVAAELQEDAREVGELQEDIDRLSRRFEALKRDVNAISQEPKISFIAQEGQTRIPVILHYSEDEMAIGWPDLSAPTFWVDGGAYRQQTRLRDLLERLDPDTHYVVHIIKPSAHGDRARKLMSLVEDAGFASGLELVQEDLDVFPKPNP